MFGRKSVRLPDLIAESHREKPDIEKLLPLQDEIVFLDGKVESESKEEKSFDLPKPWEEEKWNDYIITISERAGMKISRSNRFQKSWKKRIQNTSRA